MDGLLSPQARGLAEDSSAESAVPLVAKRTELKGPKVLGLFPFFVDDALKLKDKEKKCGRAHCIGPVMQLAIWSPLIHASVMLAFMGLGLLQMWQKTTGRPRFHSEIAYPTWWWSLAGFSCIALMYLEVYIAKYSSISYSDKASTQFQNRVEGGRAKHPTGLSHCSRCRMQVESGPAGQLPDPESQDLAAAPCGQRLVQGRLPIAWPCLPVRMIDALLCRCPFSGVRAMWHEHQDKWYFNVWFGWHFVLGTVTVYGRLQANTFLGMLLYSFLTGSTPVTVDEIWKATLTHSFFIRHSFSLTAILLFIVIAQLCHYVFGALNYCPRRRWKTADHLRWQSDKWQAWGRSFELEVKGIRSREERITQMSEWEQWRDGFDGAQAMAIGADRKEFFLTVPRGGPVYKDKVEYKPSVEDLPLTIKWDTNRHAYTSVLGEEMTSSTVMDVIAECCSMGIMMGMQSLELEEYKKAAGVLSEYQDEKEPPTERLAGKLIQAVRSLMNDAVNVTRCAFSRVFIYGVCVVGIHLHFQVTYTNVLCARSNQKEQAGGSEQCEHAKALFFGIVAAFVSMLLVLGKIVAITRYLINVWTVFRGYSRALSSEHAGLVRYKAMRGQISTARRSLLVFSALFFPASLAFVWNFVWLLAKWYMETLVCPDRMWNIPAWWNMLDPMSGCVELGPKGL